MTTPDPLAALLEPFVAKPERCGIFTDFDGTLSLIVQEPWNALPLPGAAEALHRLAARFGRVAVVSGRPVSFLLDNVGVGDGLVFFGLYGIEQAGADGKVSARPDALAWCPKVEEVACDAEEHAPAGVLVERKGVSVTVHFRTAPEHEAWAQQWAAAAAARTGLALHPARMSYELRPPVPADKGTVVTELAQGLDAVCFFGDDVGDLPAMEALNRLTIPSLKIVVNSAEIDPRLVTAADHLVDGPPGALRVMQRLLSAVDGG